MRILLVATMAASFAVAATTAHASQADSVKKVVQTYLAKFNSGDAVGALALCSETGSIIDEFAPFRWSRFSDWFKAYDVYAAQNGIAASKVRIDSFAHISVKDGRAYAVAPSTYSYTENGKPRVEAGTQVLSLEKTAGGWRITSAAWFGKNGADRGRDAAEVNTVVGAFASMSAPPSTLPSAIVDEFAPYHWEGAGANADWFAALQKDNSAGGVDHMALRLEAPSQLSVNGDKGYAVFPAVITSKHRGKAATEYGAFAFTLDKSADAWHIASWAWATK